MIICDTCTAHTYTQSRGIHIKAYWYLILAILLLFL